MFCICFQYSLLRSCQTLIIYNCWLECFSCVFVVDHQGSLSRYTLAKTLFRGQCSAAWADYYNLSILCFPLGKPHRFHSSTNTNTYLSSSLPRRPSQWGLTLILSCAPTCHCACTFRLCTLFSKAYLMLSWRGDINQTLQLLKQALTHLCKYRIGVKYNSQAFVNDVSFQIVFISDVFLHDLVFSPLVRPWNQID